MVDFVSNLPTALTLETTTGHKDREFFFSLMVSRVWMRTGFAFGIYWSIASHVDVVSIFQM
jgi:hypothetical protein